MCAHTQRSMVKFSSGLAAHCLWHACADSLHTSAPSLGENHRCTQHKGSWEARLWHFKHKHSLIQGNRHQLVFVPSKCSQPHACTEACARAVRTERNLPLPLSLCVCYIYICIYVYYTHIIYMSNTLLCVCSVCIYYM